MIALHPESRFLHIGCDEVYQLGMCEVCTGRIVGDGIAARDIFLDHVHRVAAYVREKGVIPIMWDDMLR